MPNALFHCCDQRRLDVLRAAGSANAIDFLEVLDRAAPPGVPRQRTLFVRLLRDVPATLTPDNVLIDGGERIPRVPIVWLAGADNLPAVAEPGLVDSIVSAADRARTLVIRTDSEGDFSRYSLSLVASLGSMQPPAGFDPRLSRIAFSFKVECPSDFDCADTRECPPEARSTPPIDYLAKDYPSLRRLMLDRLALTVPGWTERSAADVGVTLVELLAYAADQLSYRQDAVANEAYLATARRRVSVRRHARLVDYRLHEGCNARAWVHVQVEGADAVRVARGTPLVAEPPRRRGAPIPRVVDRGSVFERALVESGATWFEAAHERLLHAPANRMRFYTWGDAGCGLARGSTTATLREHLPLSVGDVLVLQEVLSPTRFTKGDADPAHRWAVRLTLAQHDVDPSGGLFEPLPADAPLPITRIEWEAADALPFALCVGVAERPELDISVALGNIVLADHGRSLPRESLPTVSDALRRQASTPRSADRCGRVDPPRVPVRYRPALANADLTHGFPIAALMAALPSTAADAPPMWPASLLLELPVRAATPQARLRSSFGSLAQTWTPVADLLNSSADAPHFVVETEHDRHSGLRFGDDRNGKRPNPGTAFDAFYRVGNGSAGHVGANAIAHLVLDAALYADDPASMPDAASFTLIANPMPAAGGVDPEDIEAARRDAPEAFRTQERAVTAADYAAAAERSGEVQRAAATFRWTGSWHTVFVSADRPGGADIDAGFERRLRRHLERFRMAGYDLEVDGPQHVALDLALHVCVAEGHFRADVLQALKQVLGAERQADGTLALFHPDNFSFADPVYLSRIVATAQAVTGVASVRVDRFQRLLGGSPSSIADGVIRLGRLEIAQLANNPNFRERGRLALTAGGGQ